MNRWERIAGSSSSKRHDNAIAQLGDMHGFKLVTTIEPTSPDGEGTAGA
jgi:hypothetical protein